MIVDKWEVHTVNGKPIRQIKSPSGKRGWCLIDIMRYLGMTSGKDKMIEMMKAKKVCIVVGDKETCSWFISTKRFYNWMLYSSQSKSVELLSWLNEHRR